MANTLSKLYNRSAAEIEKAEGESSSVVPVVPSAPEVKNKYQMSEEEMRNLPARKKATVDRAAADAAADAFLKKYYGSRHPDVGIKP